jgi:prophage antirepressor-like protein
MQTKYICVIGFNNYICNMINIEKFNKDSFGSLTTFTNSENGVTMFLGTEIANIWGHTNLTQAIKSANLDNSEYKVVNLKGFKEFKKQLTNLKLVGGRTSLVTLLTESGMYKLALASNLKTAQPFKDWVTKEVLPSIRKFGSYNLKITKTELNAQTDRITQLTNSKLINSENYKKNGVNSIIEYNKANCKQVSGLEPKQIKEMFNAKKGTSAKEVFRKHKPEMAAVMSLNDHLVVNHHIDLEQLKELDKAFLPAFKELNKLGIEITK